MNKFKIENISTWKYKTMGVTMDGGTLSLFFTNSKGESFIVSLGQHMIAEYYEELSGLPARIYINGQIIEKRSKAEDSLIQYLENVVVKEIKADERELIIERLEFIKSEAYLNYEPIKLELSERRKKYLESLKTNPTL